VAVVSLGSVTLFRNLAPNELKVLRLIAQERHFGSGSKIFQPFATHGKSHGTGLGLSICKKSSRTTAAASWRATSRAAARFFVSRDRWQNER
jgi:hypothetical protein